MSQVKILEAFSKMLESTKYTSSGMMCHNVIIPNDVVFMTEFVDYYKKTRGVTPSGGIVSDDNNYKVFYID